MYDVILSKKERYFESKTYSAGKKIKSFKLPWGKIGLTICYDLRFPNLYRRLSKQGSIILSVPSAFTETTGKKHWHSLLKARAIENMSYCIGVNRIGLDGKGLEYVGHSAVYNVLGDEIAFAKAEEKIITATLSKKHIKETRERLPFLQDKDEFRLI